MATAKKTTKQPSTIPVVAISDGLNGYRILIWLAFFANSVFLIWQCLDRYLAPRFLFLSVVLLVGLGLLWRDLRRHADWRLHIFDLLLLGWYGLNWVSVSWSYSWSEGIFYAQKTLLLLVVYWLVRQALQRSEVMVNRSLWQANLALTWVTCAVIIGQLIEASRQYGLDNDALYNFASGLSGNKGLASDLLFFLLIFNILFRQLQSTKWVFWLNISLLLVLIVLLQTRTVYLAIAVAVLYYCIGRAVSDTGFRPVFFKKILPAGLVAVVLLGAFIVFKGKGSSLGERLNPMTYLESASANERRVIWYKTDLLNAEHFWLGVGNGSWKIWLPSKTLIGSYRTEEQGIVFTRAHNDYLEVRAEMGIIGAVWFSTLFILTFLALFWAARYRTGDSHAIWTIGAGLLGYCVIQYFDFPRERIEMQVILAIIFAYSIYYSRALWAKGIGVSIGSYSSVWLGLGIVGMVFNSILGGYRVLGEVHNIRLIKAYGTNNYAAVLKEADAAHNLFYELNDVALPFEWYKGTVYYKQKELEKANLAMQDAYRLNSWSFQVINNFGSVLAAQRNFKDAILLFKKAVDINPKYDEGKFNLAYCNFQLGQYQEALDWVGRVDTLRFPSTKEDFEKNRAILANKEKFVREISGKMTAQ